MNVYDAVDSLSKIALERSKIYNDGEQNYAFAFGWFNSDIQALLDDMGLTKKQLKVLSDRLAQLEKL